MSEAAKKDAATPAAGKSPVTESKEKPKFDFLGLIIFVLVLTNGAVLGGLGLYMQKLWDKVAELESKTQKLETKAAPKDDGIGKELVTAPMGTLYQLESFLVNISSDQGPRFLQAQMELELSDPAADEEISRRKAAIRDAIIVLLSSRSYAELSNAAGMKRLRTDLLRTINNLLSGGKVKSIYFTQFHFN